MDLHRVAMGYNRGSEKMAERFAQEAQKRIDEIDKKMASAELADALKKCTALLHSTETKSNSSQLLFYSVYFQNEALKHKE
jgi:hypothetical protein